MRRTWPQRSVIVLNLTVAIGCVAGALALNIGHTYASSINRITLPAGVLAPVGAVDSAFSGEQKFPDAGTQPAENWLVTGSDVRPGDNCGVSGQYAGAFQQEGTGGERSDTIMVLRLDPDSSFAAVLSFPRDLWVDTGSHFSKINATFKRNDPSRLIKAIKKNFNIPINHYAQIDFCGFKAFVDAVGGIKIPFDIATRDLKTGLTVQPGCVAFSGEAALAYARSRHYQVSTDGWKTFTEDPGSDWARIRRQQLLMKRIGQKLIDEGIRTNFGKLRKLVNAAHKYITVDDTLTIEQLITFASRLRNLDPVKVKTYTWEGHGSLAVDGTSIIEPSKSKQNRNVAKIFNGLAFPAETQTAEELSSTTTRAGPTTTGPTTTLGPTLAPPLETVQVDDTIIKNATAFIPPNDPTCR